MTSALPYRFRVAFVMVGDTPTRGWREPRPRLGSPDCQTKFRFVDGLIARDPAREVVTPFQNQRHALPATGPANVTVRRVGVASDPFTIEIRAVAPGLFSANLSGTEWLGDGLSEWMGTERYPSSRSLT